MTAKTLSEQIKEWKKIQYRASQMNNASQVMRAQRELERLYKLQDKQQVK